MLGQDSKQANADLMGGRASRTASGSERRGACAASRGLARRSRRFLSWAPTI